MKKVAYNEYLKEMTEVLPKGAFLTVKGDGELNTMTIGWGTVGYVWGKPVFTVLVRDSRYTYELMEKTDEFTVSIPLNGGLKEELAFCGKESGRDYDKITECNLTTIPGQRVDTPVIKGCELHYECKIRFKQRMDQDLDKFDGEYDDKWYPTDDYHTIYHGEIVDCYIDEEMVDSNLKV